VWDEYQVQTTAQDGKIRYPDPASDTGYSERVFHAVNGSVEAVYDGTSNMPELRIRPIASEREAHAIVWRPDAGDGTTPERSIIIYDPTVGHYLPARLALKN
jgi:hypothetical protein